MKYSFGLIPSPVDTRDYKFEAILPTPAAIPDECTTWLNWKTPVKYQGEFGACAAFTGIAMKETFDTKEYGTTLDLSEQFLYTEAKKIDGFPDEQGTYFRAIFSILKNLGVCEENLYPYKGKSTSDTPPTQECYNNAVKYKIISYASVLPTQAALKRAIFQNGPVAIGINVYENFENISSDGVAQTPAGEIKGGHALTAVGYNTLGLICKNSWSPYWGKDGYCTIPWPVYYQIRMGEAWTIVDMLGGQVSAPYSNWFIELLKKIFSRWA